MPRRATTSDLQPNPRPFPYADYVEARKLLKAALKGPCFYALLTGASGMGKTELLRDITDSLDRHRYNVVYLASANISLVSIVRFLAGRGGCACLASPLTSAMRFRGTIRPTTRPRS